MAKMPGNFGFFNPWSSSLGMWETKIISDKVTVKSNKGRIARRNKSMMDMIVVAAGLGKRMGEKVNKMFLTIDGIPVLYRTLKRLNDCGCVGRIIPVIRQADAQRYEEMFEDLEKPMKVSHWVEGGKERSESVRRGLEYLMKHHPETAIGVHDGARPFFSEGLLESLIASLTEYDIVVPTMKIVETVRRIRPNGVIECIDREGLVTMQTPQVFRSDQVEDCFFTKAASCLNLTDEVGYFEQMKKRIGIINGERWNQKITERVDLDWAEKILKTHGNLDIQRNERKGEEAAAQKTLLPRDLTPVSKA